MTATAPLYNTEYDHRCRDSIIDRRSSMIDALKANGGRMTLYAMSLCLGIGTQAVSTTATKWTTYFEVELDVEKKKLFKAIKLHRDLMRFLEVA